MGKIKVYNNDLDKEVVAHVEYNTLLDTWDENNNHCNGGMGRHLGITKLGNDTFVLIHGTDWTGETDYAICVSDKEALQAILQSDHIELLEEAKFKTLKTLHDSTMIKEDES